jgi:hypothetical protein
MKHLVCPAGSGSCPICNRKRNPTRITAVDGIVHHCWTGDLGRRWRETSRSDRKLRVLNVPYDVWCEAHIIKYHVKRVRSVVAMDNERSVLPRHMMQNDIAIDGDGS